MDSRHWDSVRVLAVPVLATAAGLAVGTLFILLAGKDPGAAYEAFWTAVAGEPRMFGETLTASVPLIFTGLSVALAFRCGLFNIGAEGQFMWGQMAAAWIGAGFSMSGWVHPMAALAAAGLAGAVWAGIAGALKAFRGVHEVINTIMLNYTALHLVNWLLLEYLRAPSETGSATYPVRPTAAFVQGLIPESRLHAGLWIALAASLLVWFFLWKTPAGYEIRAVGLAPLAAEYGGISVGTNVVLAMALSGGLAGLAGGVQTLGVTGRFFEPMGFVGYGFDGISVALVGRNHPVGVVLAALLFGALERGGPLMQAAAGVPKAVIWIVQGTVIFFVAAEGLWRFLQRSRAGSGKPESGEVTAV